jgi:hypothetical protein
MARGDPTAGLLSESRHAHGRFTDVGRSKTVQHSMDSTVSAEHDRGAGRTHGTADKSSNAERASPASPPDGGRKGGDTRSREERSKAAKRGWETRRSKDAYK